MCSPIIFGYKWFGSSLLVAIIATGEDSMAVLEGDSVWLFSQTHSVNSRKKPNTNTCIMPIP